MPIKVAESQLIIFPWEARNDYLPHLTTKKPKKQNFDINNYPYNCRFTNGYPACTITFNKFKDDQMVVLHIPCNSLFSLEAFRKSFYDRKVCPKCIKDINESDLDMLSEKIQKLIESLKQTLNSKKEEVKRTKKLIARLNKTDEKETPVSLPQNPNHHEKKLKELTDKIPSNSSIIFNAGLEELLKEIKELDEKIQALENLEKRVIRENFYKPYIPTIKILALVMIFAFVAKYFFRSTVSLCSDLQN